MLEAFAKKCLARPGVVLFIILTFAAVLRLFQLGAEPFGLDEAFTHKFSEYPWSSFRQEVAETDVHPPLYYGIVKVFRGLFMTDGESVLRIPSVLLSLATIPVLFGLAINLFDGRAGKIAGLFAALLFAVSANQISVAQIARPYALMVFAMSLSAYGGTCFLRHQSRFAAPFNQLSRDPEIIKACLITIAGFSALAWSHNVGLIYAATTGATLAALLVLQDRTNYASMIVFVICGIISLIIWSPNVGALMSQTSNVADNYWIPDLTLKSLIEKNFLAFGVTNFTPFPNKVAMILSLPIIAFSMSGLLRLWRAQRRWQFFFFVLTIAAPMILFIAVSEAIRPIFLLRILHPMFVIWVLLVAFGAYSIFADWRRLVGAATVVLLFGTSSINYFLMDNRSEPWDDLVSVISARSGNGAIVYTVPNSSALPLEFYIDKLGANVRAHPIPEAFPAIDQTYTYPTGVPGVPGINAEMIENAMMHPREISGLDRWIILRGYHIYDQDNAVRSTLGENFCYERYDTGINYIVVLKLIPLEGKPHETCQSFTEKGF
ncbi:MAG: glycosyltransferase family 39 protein [Henriciella sp.]|nr:glycosyltransferase family 39 protein [Henriciella sp.]